MEPPTDRTTPSRASPVRPSLREIWQVPALIGAVLVLGGALALAVLTSPKPNFGSQLRAAESRIERERYDEALHILNDDLLAHLDTRGFGPENRRLFHVLRARAIALGQRAIGVDKRENHQNVIGEYLEAERQNAQLLPRDTHILARAMIALGLLDRALQRAAALPESQRDRRMAIVQEVIEAKMGRDQRDRDGALALLAQILEDPRLTGAEAAWALAHQARLLIEDGYEDEAIAKLLRTMPRLPRDVDPSALGELSMLLGRAYLETGAVDDASKHLHRAIERLLPGETVRGDAEVLLARADELRGELAEARDRYAGVVEDFGTEPALLPALMGLGRVLAQLEDQDGARRAYQQLVDTHKEGVVAHRDVDRSAIGDSLMARFADRYAAGRNDQALDYAMLAEDLYGIDEAPDAVIRALADANRRLADERLGELGTGLDRVMNLAELDPASREQARRNFIAAGSYYSILADRVTISDNEEYADALWYGADCFDAGGDRTMAIQAFERYANEIPDDPRQAEARYRLAQAHQARGDYPEAATLYRELISDGDDPDAGRGAGPFAQASYVPLAQTYLLDLDDSNDEQAELLLKRITGGDLGTAEASYFREGLITLGRLYYQRGRWVEAIETLEDAIARYPEDERVAQLSYLLADAYRLEADAIRTILQDAMPDHERRAFEEQRRSHLRRALTLYDRARDGLERKDSRRLTGVETTYLRNAYFYLGACAFDLGDYDAAIAYYNTARERFPKDPATLVAMIQIVHAHVERGEFQSARTANERARRFYESLPPSAWDDPALPMRRDDWERWLDLTSRLEGRADAGG